MFLNPLISLFPSFPLRPPAAALSDLFLFYKMTTFCPPEGVTEVHQKFLDTLYPGNTAATNGLVSTSGDVVLPSESGMYRVRGGTVYAVPKGPTCDLKCYMYWFPLF